MYSPSRLCCALRLFHIELLCCTVLFGNMIVGEVHRSQHNFQMLIGFLFALHILESIWTCWFARKSGLRPEDVRSASCMTNMFLQAHLLRKSGKLGEYCETHAVSIELTCLADRFQVRPGLQAV